MKYFFITLVYLLLASNFNHAQNRSECAEETKMISKNIESWKSLYSVALCYSSVGKKLKTHFYLNKAIKYGLNDITLIREKGFQLLKDTPEWDEILSGTEINILKNTNVDLYQMFRRDQAIRIQREPDWDWDLDTEYESDEDRLNTVYKLIDNNQLKSANDYYHAAMILQHGKQPENYRLAHELSKKAISIRSNHQNARWLSCAAEDRYLWSINKSQIWGTQRKVGDNGWTLEPFDTTRKNDTERAECGVPPLKQLLANIDTLNTQ